MKRSPLLIALLTLKLLTAPTAFGAIAQVKAAKARNDFHTAVHAALAGMPRVYRPAVIKALSPQMAPEKIGPLLKAIKEPGGLESPPKLSSQENSALEAVLKEAAPEQTAVALRAIRDHLMSKTSLYDEAALFNKAAVTTSRVNQQEVAAKTDQEAKALGKSDILIGDTVELPQELRKPEAKRKYAPARLKLPPSALDGQAPPAAETVPKAAKPKIERPPRERVKLPNIPKQQLLDELAAQGSWPKVGKLHGLKDYQIKRIVSESGLFPEDIKEAEEKFAQAKQAKARETAAQAESERAQKAQDKQARRQELAQASEEERQARAAQRQARQSESLRARAQAKRELLLRVAALHNEGKSLTEIAAAEQVDLETASKLLKEARRQNLIAALDPKPALTKEQFLADFVRVGAYKELIREYHLTYESFVRLIERLQVTEDELRAAAAKVATARAPETQANEGEATQEPAIRRRILRLPGRKNALPQTTKEEYLEIFANGGQQATLRHYAIAWHTDKKLREYLGITDADLPGQEPPGARLERIKEAVRLVDDEKLTYEQAAERMKKGRSTISTYLTEAVKLGLRELPTTELPAITREQFLAAYTQTPSFPALRLKWHLNGTRLSALQKSLGITAEELNALRANLSSQRQETDMIKAAELYNAGKSIEDIRQALDTYYEYGSKLVKLAHKRGLIAKLQRRSPKAPPKAEPELPEISREQFLKDYAEVGTLDGLAERYQTTRKTIDRLVVFHQLTRQERFTARRDVAGKEHRPIRQTAELVKQGATADDIAKEFGISKVTANAYIRDARARGFLPAIDKMAPLTHLTKDILLKDYEREGRLDRLAETYGVKLYWLEKKIEELQITKEELDGAQKTWRRALSERKAQERGAAAPAKDDEPKGPSPEEPAARDADVKRAAELRSQGLSGSAIADKTGWSQAHTYVLLTEAVEKGLIAPLAREQVYSKLPDMTREQFLQLYSEKRSESGVLRHLKIGRLRLRRLMKQLGITKEDLPEVEQPRSKGPLPETLQKVELTAKVHNGGGDIWAVVKALNVTDKRAYRYLEMAEERGLIEPREKKFPDVTKEQFLADLERAGGLPQLMKVYGLGSRTMPVLRKNLGVTLADIKAVKTRLQVAKNPYRQKIVELYKAGKSPVQISKEMNLDYTIVSKYLREAADAGLIQYTPWKHR